MGRMNVNAAALSAIFLNLSTAYNNTFKDVTTSYQKSQ
jgi:hypothetical protein